MTFLQIFRRIVRFWPIFGCFRCEKLDIRAVFDSFAQLSHKFGARNGSTIHDEALRDASG